MKIHILYNVVMLGVYIGVFEDAESIPGVYIVFWAMFGPKWSHNGLKLGQKGATLQVKIEPNLSLTFIIKYDIYTGFFDDAEPIPDVYILFPAIIWA